MKYITFVLLILFSFELSKANDLRTPDVRNLGMGENDLVNSLLFNPALMVLNKDRQIYFEFVNRYQLKELNTFNGAFIYPFELLTTAVEITSFGYKEYKENMFRFSLGKQLDGKWSAGIGIQYKMLQSDLYEFIPAALSIDVGVSYKPVDNLFINLLIVDFPSVKINQNGIDYKMFELKKIQTGFRWYIIQQLLISSGISFENFERFSGSFGLEYLAFENFHLRAGIHLSPFRPSIGVGYSFLSFTVDAAALFDSVLGISSGLAVSYSF